MPKYELDLSPSEYEALVDQLRIDQATLKASTNPDRREKAEVIGIIAHQLVSQEKDRELGEIALQEFTPTSHGLTDRIDHNLEVLRQTNERLSQKNGPTLPELFEKADRIMDKPIYQAESAQVQTERPFSTTPDLEVETGSATQQRHEANQTFYYALEQAAQKFGASAHGIHKIDLDNGVSITSIEGEVVVTSQDGKGRQDVIYGKTRETAHLSGIGSNHLDKLSRSDKIGILEQVQDLENSRESKSSKSGTSILVVPTVAKIQHQTPSSKSSSAELDRT